MLEHPFQPQDIPLVEHRPVAVGQGDVALLAVLVQEMVQRKGFSLQVQGQVPLQEINARRKGEVQLGLYRLHPVGLELVCPHQAVGVQQRGQFLEQERSRRLLGHDEESSLLVNLLLCGTRRGIPVQLFGE